MKKSHKAERTAEEIDAHASKVLAEQEAADDDSLIQAVKNAGKKKKNE